MELIEICKRAKDARQEMAVLSTDRKNQALLAVAEHFYPSALQP